MRLLFRFLLALLMLMSFATIVFAANNEPGSDILKKVDSLYAKRADLSNVSAGLKLLAPYIESNSYEALWRAARANYWLGHMGTGKERLQLSDKGKALADRAIKADDKGPDGYYWLAACIGQAGLERGILNSLMQVKPMKAALDKVLSLDPKYANAHRVLAELYYKVPGWPISIGDAKKAVYHAQEALKHDPKSIRYNRVAAEAYFAAKDSKLAKVYLENVIRLPLSAEEPEDDQKDKEWAQKELRKL